MIVLQIEQLKQHLIDSGCSPDEFEVWLGEDGTSIINRIEYQSHDGQVCGFVLPTDKQTGMPITGSFPASSVKDVFNYFKNAEQAKIVYAIVAVPLNNKAAPFVLNLMKQQIGNKFRV